MKNKNWFIWGVITFIKNILSSGTNESSKRTFGGLLIVNSMAVNFRIIITGVEVSDFSNTLFWGG